MKRWKARYYMRHVEILVQADSGKAGRGERAAEGTGRGRAPQQTMIKS